MDEADKMLGMGMEEQLRKVVGLATSTIRARQTLLWTATMPESLERLARSAVINPIHAFNKSGRHLFFFLIIIQDIYYCNYKEIITKKLITMF